jgi:hypothetical protein
MYRLTVTDKWPGRCGDEPGRSGGRLRMAASTDQHKLYQTYFKIFTTSMLSPIYPVWWNFSLMRKYAVELQAYNVLNFSVMGCEPR